MTKKARKPAAPLRDAAKEVLPKLQAGKTTLSAERDRLGLSSNGPLRKALTELLGGKAAYQKMMAESHHENGRSTNASRISTSVKAKGEARRPTKKTAKPKAPAKKGK